MELILHDEIWRQKPIWKDRVARYGGWTVHDTKEVLAGATMHTPKHGGSSPSPGKHCKLVDRCDNEARELTVNLLIDEQDRNSLAIVGGRKSTIDVRAPHNH